MTSSERQSGTQGKPWVQLRWAGQLVLFTGLVTATLFVASREELLRTICLAGLSFLTGARLVRMWPDVLVARSGRLLERAREAFSADDRDRAFQLARRAWISASPGTPTQANSLALMAWILNHRGQGTQALRALSLIPEGAIPPPIIRAEAYLQTGESSLALTLLEEEHATQPDNHVTAIGAGLGQLATRHFIPEMTHLLAATQATFGVLVLFTFMKEALAACFQAVAAGRWFPRIWRWPLTVFIAGFASERVLGHLWSALGVSPGMGSSSPSPEKLVLYTFFSTTLRGVAISFASG